MTAWNLGIQESGNTEIWDPKNQKNTNSQNQNPCRPKCWQCLGLVGKNTTWPHLGLFQAIYPWAEKTIFRNFPWWAIGPYSPGLGLSIYIWQG